MTLSRRSFLSSAALAGVAGAAGAVGLGELAGGTADASVALPSPGATGIKHIVVVMMENRSFDHFLGWYGPADGKQSGLHYFDRYGRRRNTFHQTRFASCGFNDPDHSYEGGRIEFNSGRCDGWLKAGENDSLSISYYQQPDLAFFGKAVPDWTVCDRYFAATMAETYPNRFYQHAAKTDRLHNSLTQSKLTTIWDRLKAKNVSGTYYYSDVPFLALWGQKHLDISEHYSKFLTDAAAGTLPSVSFIDPRFEDEASGSSADDHPHADIRAGEAFLNEVYTAVTTGPGWPNTLLVINYDEWGGFFDHVAPGLAPDAHPWTARRGFRVPALLVSPHARPRVSHTVFDHTSVLRAIEWRWGLRPLTKRDAHANNILTALDFSAAPRLTAPSYGAILPPPPTDCSASPPSTVGEASEWSGLRRLARNNGWKLPS